MLAFREAVIATTDSAVIRELREHPCFDRWFFDCVIPRTLTELRAAAMGDMTKAPAAVNGGQKKSKGGRRALCGRFKLTATPEAPSLFDDFGVKPRSGAKLGR
jgi:hypothetical protein